MNTPTGVLRFFAKLAFALVALMLAVGAQAKSKCNIGDGPIKYGQCVDAEAKAAAKQAKEAAAKAAAASKAAAQKAAAAGKNAADKTAAQAKAAADKAAAAAKAAADKAAADAKAATSNAMKQQVCMDTVKAINEGKALAFMDGAKNAAKKEARILQAKLKDAGQRNKVLQKVDTTMSKLKEAIPELKRLQEVAKRSDALAKLFRTPDLICSGDVRKINGYLERNGLKPKLPSLLKAEAGPSGMDGLIPSAHAYFGRNAHFFTGFQVSLTLGSGLTGSAALSYTTDWKDNGALGLSVAGGATEDVTAQLGASVTFYPLAEAKDFAGSGAVPDVSLSVVIGVGTPKIKVGGNLEFPFTGDFELVGIAVGGIFGAGINPLTVDATVNFGWTLWAHKY